MLTGQGSNKQVDRSGSKRSIVNPKSKDNSRNQSVISENEIIENSINKQDPNSKNKEDLKKATGNTQSRGKIPTPSKNLKGPGIILLAKNFSSETN